MSCCHSCREMFSPRKAKDTDYLLITEDMKTYGCGCCSIGLGEGKVDKRKMRLMG